MSRLPFYKPFDLGKLKFEIGSKFHDILNSGSYTKGERSKELADAVAAYTGYDYAVPLGQATHGIFIMAQWYKKAGIRRVYVPAFTWPSSYTPFQWLGFEVRFTDINRNTWLAEFPETKLDIDELRLPVDTFGSVFPARLDDPVPFVDSAQSLGAKWDSTQPTRIVSLSGSKILTSGEGGILLTQEEGIRDFAISISGWFSRMNEMEAVLGLAYFSKIDKILERKAEIAREYARVLKNITWQEKPIATNDYIVAGLVEDPQAVIRNNPDFEFRRYYESIVNETNDRIAMADLDGLPNTKYVADHIIAFPSYPDMPIDRIKNIVT